MVPYDQVFSVLALYERKNRKQEKEKYRSAACPGAPLSQSKGLPKGRQKNADCVSPVNN